LKSASRCIIKQFLIVQNSLDSVQNLLLNFSCNLEGHHDMFCAVSKDNRLTEDRSVGFYPNYNFQTTCEVSPALSRGQQRAFHSPDGVVQNGLPHVAMRTHCWLLCSLARSVSACCFSAGLLLGRCFPAHGICLPQVQVFALLNLVKCLLAQSSSRAESF